MAEMFESVFERNIGKLNQRITVQHNNADDAWSIIDAIRNAFPKDWFDFIYLSGDLKHDAAVDYEMHRRAHLGIEHVHVEPPNYEPVVDHTDEDVRQGVEAARAIEGDQRPWWRQESLGPANYDSTWAPDVPHNYITGIGDCFDWLDHDTRLMVREAIEEADTDDIEEFAEVAASRWRQSAALQRRAAVARRGKSKRINELLEL